MREVVIISGKGGAGKTSLTAAFAVLAENKVLADCDVDAADLHILTDPKVKNREDFIGGVKAVIDSEKCVQCGQCIDVCRFESISPDFNVSPFTCEGCGVCSHICPEQAIELVEPVNGRWFISSTRFGPMVHAELNPGEENSGKLVALVRNQARVLAEQAGHDLILVDGAPGIGCPVISSITGADCVIIVTEPSLSGVHDMERVLKLAKGFNLPISIVVNKADINSELTAKIETFAKEVDASFLGKIPYDPDVTRAMVQRRSVVEVYDGPASAAIREIWNNFNEQGNC